MYNKCINFDPNNHHVGKSLLTATCIFFASLSAISQVRLVIDDRVQLLDSELEQLIREKLADDSIQYTDVVDYRERCLYYFTELVPVGEDVVLSVKNCVDDVLGSKNLGKRILSSSTQEKGLLLTYAILDIVSDPGKYRVEVNTGSVNRDEEMVEVVRKDTGLTNEHDTRYFFAPSAYYLKKGELYYNTVYFLIHDIQYGVHDRFSIGIGTTVIGLPIYLTPKISFPIGKKSAIALGDMLLFGTWGTNAMGNLAYGIFSTGGADGNISVGAGHLYTNESNITGQTSSLVTNFSAMARLSPYIFLLTENYLLSVNVNRQAWYNLYDPVLGYYDYISENYVQRNTIWYGIAGIRIIAKNRDFISWQIGLTYVVNFPGEIPEQYSSWETDAPKEINLIAFPTVSLTVKFGKKF
jgi:hypothetical protein